LITLAVFLEESTDAPTPRPVDGAEDLAALARGALPDGRVRTLDELKSRLRGRAARGGTRGLIVEGEKVKARIRPTAFRAAPTPVMAASIIYYTP
jgi:hypothetical protein